MKAIYLAEDDLGLVAGVDDSTTSSIEKTGVDIALLG